MEKITFTRQELYDLVWSTPMTTLTLKYNVSFHKLRSTCVKMNIPLPDYGHWMRIQHNKPVHIKELQDDYTGEDFATITLKDDTDQITPNKTEDRKNLRNKILSDKKLSTNVSSKLRNPDKLIVAALNDLNSNKHPDYSTGLITTSGKILDITVAPKNIGRALRFMNTFIKLLRDRGHDVKITENGTCPIVFGEEIIICLQEKLRIEESMNSYGWNSRKYFPSDILTFRMWKTFRFNQKVWGTGIQVIEDLLPDILVRLEMLAKKEIEERKRREVEHKIWREKHRIEEEKKERIENEYKQFKKLFRQANLLHKANILRGYVKAVETHAIQNGDMSGELKDWIGWATNKIDWFDPLITKEDPVLDDNFRKTLYQEIKEGRI
jgi:hypothetical protein